MDKKEKKSFKYLTMSALIGFLYWYIYGGLTFYLFRWIGFAIGLLYYFVALLIGYLFIKRRRK